MPAMVRRWSRLTTHTWMVSLGKELHSSLALTAVGKSDMTGSSLVGSRHQEIFSTARKRASLAIMRR